MVNTDTNRIRRNLTSVKDRFLDLFFPPQCPCCHDAVVSQGTLCAQCWSNVTFVSDPVCECCGYPFEYDAGSHALCAGCIAQPPLFSQARSALQYDDHSRRMILSFKHGDQTDQAAPFANWMLRAGRELLQDCPLLIPVPLHPKRLLKRRYNQASLLANHLGHLTKLDVDHLNFQRIKATDSQGFKSLKARHKNVKGAFMFKKEASHTLKDRPVLLIDDVFTTGATLNECAKNLLKSGAPEVRALTLARVIRATSLTD